MVVQVRVAALTTNVTVALRTKLPLVPVMVSVYVPACTLVVVLTVKVEEPDPLIEVGLKLPVAPAGNPLTLRLTLPVNPFNAPTVVVYDVPLPAVTVCDDGLAERVKFGTGALTTYAKASSNI